MQGLCNGCDWTVLRAWRDEAGRPTWSPCPCHSWRFNHERECSLLHLHTIAAILWRLLKFCIEISYSTLKLRVGPLREISTALHDFEAKLCSSSSTTLKNGQSCSCNLSHRSLRCAVNQRRAQRSFSRCEGARTRNRGFSSMYILDQRC